MVVTISLAGCAGEPTRTPTLPVSQPIIDLRPPATAKTTIKRPHKAKPKPGPVRDAGQLPRDAKGRIIKVPAVIR